MVFKDGSFDMVSSDWEIFRCWDIPCDIEAIGFLYLFVGYHIMGPLTGITV